MNEELPVHLYRSAEMHVVFTNSLIKVSRSTGKDEVFARFLSISISHHEAMLLILATPRLAGSALALWRSLVEACFRGCFVAFKATEPEIEHIKQGAFKYPPFNEMTTLIEDKLGIKVFFDLFGGETWKKLCGFTHGGLEQLSRRRKADGTIGGDYESELIIGAVVSSTCLLGLTVIAYLGLRCLFEDGDRVGDQLVRYLARYKD